MPINKKMMHSLKEEYGENGENIYFAIENKNKWIKKKKGVKKRLKHHEMMEEKEDWVKKK